MQSLKLNLHRAVQRMLDLNIEFQTFVHHVYKVLNEGADRLPKPACSKQAGSLVMGSWRHGVELNSTPMTLYD
jgi:hypothetical protein